MAKPTTNFIDKHVGMRLRRMRMFRDLSQAQLAAALGISLRQLQKHESGFQRIDARELAQICKVLHVRPSFFFDELQINGPIAAPCVDAASDAQNGISLEGAAKRSAGGMGVVPSARAITKSKRTTSIFAVKRNAEPQPIAPGANKAKPKRAN